MYCHKPHTDFTFTTPFYSEISLPHFTVRSHNPILQWDLTTPFYCDMSQPHFTVICHNPILLCCLTTPTYSDVHINDVTITQLPVIRNAMTHHIVDGGAHRLGKAAVQQGWGVGSLGHTPLVHCLVQFICCHSNLSKQYDGSVNHDTETNKEAEQTETTSAHTQG